jgi:uncharacterized protein (UPF0305 family)
MFFCMKRFFLLAVAGMMAGAVMFAQEPQIPEGMPQMPKILTPEEKTADMAAKYELTDAQQAALLELNKKYDGKLEFRMPEQTEQRDFRKMSDAEREKFMNEMMSRMNEMQAKQAEIEENQKAYEEELKNIFDKKQLRKYRTDQRRAEAERQQAMQRGFGGGMPGGGMMPPGGGFPGGGFPGGGFGGPGGF